MTRTYNRKTCDPAEDVQGFTAKLAWKKKRVSGKSSIEKAKLSLVRAQLKTPSKPREKRGRSILKSGSSNTSPMKGQRSVIDAQLSNHDWQQEPDVFVPFDYPSIGKMNNANSSNDYMRHWKSNKERAYLDEILLNEVSRTRNCTRCSESVDEWSELWRCKDCFSTPVYCRDCCRDAHKNNPFHRVEVWNKTHFTPTWLWRTGLTVSLCSDRQCSPSLDGLTDIRGLPDPGDITFGAKPLFRVASDSVRSLTVVHTNGIHHILAAFCCCASHEGGEPHPQDTQLLRASLYPASDKDVRTVFTFAMLDHYLLDNLECYTSSLHFFSKLKRLTNEVYPKGVASCSGSLSRGVTVWEAVAQAQGIKASRPWPFPKEAKQGRYGAFFVPLVHRMVKISLQTGEVNKDVWLKEGEGYLVEPKEYRIHVENAKEEKEVPTCNEHRAVADRSKTAKGCDVTGVASWTFRKANGSLQTTGALTAPRLNLLYDINCQYCVNLRKRFQKCRTLDMPAELEIVFGIGQFHVHGHQEQCYARFSPHFIDGIGKTSGEILEPLWSKLNEAGRPTQTMTLAHRAEALDGHIADNNWKKLINLPTSISSAFERATRERHRTREAFEVLNETASASQRLLWQSSLDRALSLRVKGVRKIKEMDILNVALEKPPTRSRVQHDLMEAERESNAGLGVTSWVASGFKIQESQYRLLLKAIIRALPRSDLALKSHGIVYLIGT
ncbi:hypothetical protein BKA70DRAFT_1218492 [Coprinopsis sp. MPI-PUGE-AT-0042]|nr:hypothetical protein BKA70DRAFT_1218492 [Coprinopsis sp. MPI-PUGE-AT-0042]